MTSTLSTKIDYEDNILEDINLTSAEIANTISRYRLEFSQERNNKVEFGMRLPMFVDAFYACVNAFQYIPTQEEAFGFYLSFSQDELSKISKEDFSGLNARFKRTYPSIIRDLHFNKYVSENLPEGYNAIYNTELDVCGGIDLLIEHGSLKFGFCFYTDTERGREARFYKESRHSLLPNITYIEMPILFKGSEKAGEFFLYGEREFKELMRIIDEKETDLARHIPLYSNVPSENRYLSYLPFYEVKVACGAFIDGGVPEEIGWIDVDTEGIKGNPNRFVVRASGDSMLPEIKSGDLCVFERNWAGTRNGHIVLAQCRDFEPDYSGRYTIKKYHSEAKMTGEWEVEKTIDLIPLNPDYETIHLSDEEDVKIVGVLVGIIESGEFKEIDSPEVEEHIGFCIRCGKEIDYSFNDQKQILYCKDCWRTWHANGDDMNNPEVHCHRCGQKKKPKFKDVITYNYPICADCWNKK